MIVSYKHKFIFIKTAKTAGTSTEIALSKFLGPDDIITPISPRDERLRARLGYRGAQNYRVSLKCLEDDSVSDFEMFNHIDATTVRSIIGSKIWEECFKFCIERNPWDRVISHYYYATGKRSRPSISQYLASGKAKALKRRGSALYTDEEGKLMVDRVCRFETLEADLEWVRRHVGVPEKLELPRAKSRFRTDKRHYSKIFTEGERQTIAEIFSEEITRFDYRFEAGEDQL